MLGAVWVLEYLSNWERPHALRGVGRILNLMAKSFVHSWCETDCFFLLFSLLPRGSVRCGLVSSVSSNVITNLCLARCRWNLKSGDTVVCAFLVRCILLYLCCVCCSQEALSGEAWFLSDLPKWSRTYVSRGVGEHWNLVTPSCLHS